MSCLPAVTNGYPVEKLSEGWVSAEVTFRRRDGREETRIEIIDLKTKNRYLHEPMRTTAFKCFGLVLFTLVYLAAYLAFHLVRAISVTLTTVIEGGTRNQIGAVLKEGIWTLVRAPFFALRMEFAALYGMFKPLEGRKWVADIESKWHQKASRYDLGFAEPDLTLGAFCWGAFADPNFSYTCFLAICMQPFGKTIDPHILAVKEIDLRHGS